MKTGIRPPHPRSLKARRAAAKMAVTAGNGHSFMSGEKLENLELRELVAELQQMRDALRESEERNRGIVETAVNAIITINERGIIQSANTATERIFGYARSELIGQPVSMLMPSPYHEQHDEYIQRYQRTGERKIIGIGRETVARRKDGSIFPVDLSVGEVKLDSGRVFTGIIRDISERKQLEQKILDISEETQQRIGQDIHDDLCQQLAAIGCLAQAALNRVKQVAPAETGSIEEIVKLLVQANSRAREMSHGLAPVVLESEGLMSALNELATGTATIFHVNCRFVCDSPVLVRDNRAATQLYRIAQEAVSNAVRHSHAVHIVVTLDEIDGKVYLRIHDNGIGIHDHSPGRGTGLGLLTMTHRARMLGGTLTVGPGSFGGTLVECIVPSPDTVNHDA